MNICQVIYFYFYFFLAISPGDQPKPLYAQLFKSSGGRPSETHTEAPQSVSVPTQNYSSPSLQKSTSPVCC